jgi:hypothetical protein
MEQINYKNYNIFIDFTVRFITQLAKSSTGLGFCTVIYRYWSVVIVPISILLAWMPAMGRIRHKYFSHVGQCYSEIASHRATVSINQAVVWFSCGLSSSETMYLNAGSLLTTFVAFGDLHFGEVVRKQSIFSELWRQLQLVSVVFLRTK